MTFNSGLSLGDIRCVSVSIFDDTRIEDEEDFNIIFGSRSGISVNPDASSATITIYDDDGEQINSINELLHNILMLQLL